jgi:hypothetical protein
MNCVHLQQLVQLCHDSDIRLSSSDLIHMVCKQCGKQDVCPSALVEQYEAQHADELDDPVPTARLPSGGSPSP